MAARRNILNGASAWELKEKTNQQRDYAAQLQEQVRQKQAKQEQEKAHRQEEQREELEMLERERATATRKHQPKYQEPTANEPPPPAPSPQRAVSMVHIPVVESQQQGAPSVSPLESVSAGAGFTSAGITSGVTTTEYPQHNVADSYTPAFSSAPSGFESILREPGIGVRSIAFYEDLTALQRLAAELESASRHRRTEAQSIYIKPNFLHHRQEALMASPAAMQSPVNLSDDNETLEDNQLDNHHHHAVHQPRLRSTLEGLFGESVLLPLSTVEVSPLFSHSKSISRAREPSTKPFQRFVTALETADDDLTAMNALDNDSEMLHFTTTYN